MLREGLGNLPVVIPDTQKSPVIVISQWLVNGGLPEGMCLGGDVDLEDSQVEGGVVRVRGMYLESDEIRRHIEFGKQAVRLALSWQDRVDFVVDQDLSLRHIRYSNELKGINEELHEDVLARRDADFLLMGETLSTLQTTIAKTFGGISE